MTHPNAAARPTLQSLRDAAPTLNPTMRRVAEVILADPLAAGSASITTVAATADAAPPQARGLGPVLATGGSPGLGRPTASRTGATPHPVWSRALVTRPTPKHTTDMR